MGTNWEYSNIDEVFIDKLQGFIPEKVFDSHAHLYRLSDLQNDSRGYLNEGPENAGFAVWKDCIGRIVQGVELCGGLFFPMVTPNCSIDSSNRYLLEQLEASPHSRGLMLISPDTAVDKVKEYLKSPQVIGFKPYFYFSSETPKEESSILGFLPEWTWEMAHSASLTIMLHIAKYKAMADPDNQKVIRQMCRKYPDVKLILAHGARGFHPQNTVEGLDGLKELHNVWFDSSALCEAKALKTVLKCFGAKKLLWGTDFPISQIRGKCVSVGDGFVWLYSDTIRWNGFLPSCNPILLGIESLLALREAAEDLELNGEDIQNIFIGNASDLFGLKASLHGEIASTYSSK